MRDKVAEAELIKHTQINEMFRCTFSSIKDAVEKTAEAISTHLTKNWHCGHILTPRLNFVGKSSETNNSFKY